MSTDKWVNEYQLFVLYVRRTYFWPFAFTCVCTIISSKPHNGFLCSLTEKGKYFDWMDYMYKILKFYV